MPSCPPVLVSAEEMRALEQAVITSGCAEEALMNEAGAGIARVVRVFHPVPGTAVVFAGKGHNGGDACVVAAHLLDAGWRVEVRLVWPEAACRPLALRKLAAVRERVTFAPLESDRVPSGRPLLVIDGVLGIGAGPGLRSPVKEASRTMNRLREQHFAETVAIDLPTGLHADSGEADSDTVIADLTVTPGFPKRGLGGAGAERFTGRLAVVPLASLPCPENAEARDRLITPAELRQLVRPRPFTIHKGQAGRIGILAGSEGLTGAARLTAAAAATAGGGLVTLFCPQDVYGILAAACPPDIMVRPVNSCLEVMEFNLDAIGVGPGIGPAPPAYLASLLRDDPRPVVVDADALNLMAAHGVSLRDRIGGPRLLTPHPGELARLGKTFVPEAADAGAALAAHQQATFLRKGSRSAIIEAGRPVSFNTTGHPMMARGGMGDILTGFCATFAGQGMSLYDAACLGSWLLGYSAEQARLTDGDRVESFTPGRLLEFAGQGFAALRSGDAC